MKVGVLIEFTSNTDIDAKFAELKEMGVDSCQLVCWDRPTLQDDAMAEAINKGLEKYGIHATAFWCGWEGRRVWDFYEGQLTLGLIPSDYRVERLKMLMEGSDFAKKIHVTDLATHVGYMPENPYDPKYEEVLVACKAIVEKCKENGQNFLFETGQETPVTLKRAIQDIEKAVGKGNVGINLDPANLIMYGKANPVDALEVFGEYVMGIHGKDGKYPTDGHYLGDEVPLGQGKVNYSAFIAKLKEIGYQVGAGFMVGSPFQTTENLIEDLMFLKELQPEMVGIGPFIPHHDTQFAKDPAGSVEMTLFLLAVIRILLPKVLLPATTALGTMDPLGREKGLQAGANVVMPNLSPVKNRKQYELYDNKICTGEEAAECRGCMGRRVASVGYELVTERGDAV